MTYLIGYTDGSGKYGMIMFEASSLELAFKGFKKKYPKREIQEMIKIKI